MRIPKDQNLATECPPRLKAIDIFTDVVAVLSLFVMVYFVALMGYALVEEPRLCTTYLDCKMHHD